MCTMQRQSLQTPMDVVEESFEENPKKPEDTCVQKVPMEPLLGSITTNATIKEEKGVQIRSSARVFKKMKLEQEQDKKHEETSNAEGTAIPPNVDNSSTNTDTAEKGNELENKGHTVRSSNRVVKKAPANSTDTKGKKDDQKSDIKKETRKWTYEEKMMFFEAVNEFGREFENIQQYINSKLKKKGVPDDHMKTKEHVRQLYIRTFHEVSKHVKFSNSVKKVVQELYGIINYGELYKKLGVVTEKACMKLNELIYRGSTCIRVKGKNNRVKTPMCRALIKLNQLDEKYEEVKLPNRVLVELRPRDLTSYLKVQCLAQNPRLRTTLPIQKRLNVLFECLNKRWRSVDAIQYEKSVTSHNSITHECVPSQQEVEEKLRLMAPKLNLSPPADAKIELPSINISEYLTRQTICLTAYETRMGLDTYKEIISTMSKRKKPKLDLEHKVLENCDTIKTASVIKLESSEINHCYEPEPDNVLAEVVDDAVNTILSLQSLDRQQSEVSEAEDVAVKAVEAIKQEQPQKILPKAPEITEEDLEQIENIKKGWTEETSESLTIGEIYLMYGSDSKLIIEYSWLCDGNESTEKSKNTAANFLEAWNNSLQEYCASKQRNLEALSKLLSLAKLHYGQNNTKCSCGHVCGSKASSAAGKAKRASLTPETSVKQEDAEYNNHGYSSGSSFKQPNGPVVQTPTMQQQLNSIQKLKPKFCNRKGRRLRQKQIVVERKLPLLPNNLSGHQIVRMSIIPQEPPKETPSPEPQDEQQEPKLEEVFADPDEDSRALSAVSPSPSQLLKENEWINAEVGDYSLSSLLRHLESPLKTPGPMTMNSSFSPELSNEVDAQLQNMMTESSMDFAASFADLAARVVNDKKF